MVRAIIKQEEINVPEDVIVSVSKKIVTVKGKLGELVKSFSKFPVQLSEVKEDNKVKKILVRIWFAKTKERSLVNTISKHMKNMINGVSKGFKYVMKYGAAKLKFIPVSTPDQKVLNIENFYARKQQITVKALDGVKIYSNPDDKTNTITVTGIDLNAIGTVCAVINQKCRSRGLDKRKFADGVYIFERGFQS